MSYSKESYYKKLFLTAAFYDFILGISFLFFYKPLFRFLEIPLPSNPSYLSLSAAFVLVLGIAYYFIYKNIRANRDLAIIGTIYKLAYIVIGIYYLLLNLVPHLIFLAFAVIDFVFLVLFIEFLLYTKNREQESVT
ncbi:hypothetical protein ACFLYY_00165 [Patescibacteria group bacterium]